MKEKITSIGNIAKIESMKEIALGDKAIAKRFPAPSLKGKIKIKVMPERCIFYCRENQYDRLCKTLIAKFPRSTITRLN